MGAVMTFSMDAAVFTSPVLPCAIIMAIVNGIKGNQSRMQIYCAIAAVCSFIIVNTLVLLHS